VRLAAIGARERARAAAALLGVPLVEEQLAPCWCCQSVETTDNISPTCWPPSGHAAVACTCAIEAKPSARLAA
jgi:hypothetical protein